MQFTWTLRVLLALSGAIAFAIGGSILFTPDDFHAGNGIVLEANPSLYSEVRAPGGALMMLGALMFAGAIVRRLAVTSLIVATTVYLSYGAARFVSLVLDGVPSSGLLGATLAELVIGGLCAATLLRSHPHERSDSHAAGLPELS